VTIKTSAARGKGAKVKGEAAMANPAVIDDHATRVLSTRRVARYVAVGMALVAAVVYCLIALDVLHVMEVIDNAGRAIPAIAAGAFVLGYPSVRPRRPPKTSARVLQTSPSLLAS
jgi:hypothetical protein